METTLNIMNIIAYVMITLSMATAIMANWKRKIHDWRVSGVLVLMLYTVTAFFYAEKVPYREGWTVKVLLLLVSLFIGSVIYSALRKMILKNQKM